MSVRAVFGWLCCGTLLYVTGCGGPAAPTSDAGAPVCTSHADCNDGLFCSGVERCMPSSPDALANGCLLGDLPCDDGSCDENADQCDMGCQDRDQDGHSPVSCGGDDCDDNDPNRFPGNAEVCDAGGHDEDCDPCTVGGRDLDNDLFIDARCTNPIPAGAPPSCGITVQVNTTLSVVRGLDCQDDALAINPGQAETCNALDDDCDGMVDENLTLEPFWPDLDMDQAGDLNATPSLACARPEGMAAVGGDCDDTNPLVRPLATELCDELDNDCDDEVDEQSSSYTFYLDSDGDGVGKTGVVTTAVSCTPPVGYSTLPADCDDTNPLIYPGAPELCDRVDNNCSSPTNAGGPALNEDADGDGHAPVGATCDSSAGGTFPADDCDDTNASVHPGATEFCSAVDENCNGTNDESGQDVCSPGDTCNQGCEAHGGLSLTSDGACLVLDDATVACWGQGYDGVERIAGLTGVAEVVKSSSHVCARREDRTVACWGPNDAGQLGVGHAGPVSGLASPLGLPPVVALSAGWSRTCGLEANGHVWCWGDNENGGLGLGHMNPVLQPARVPGLDGVVELDAGAGCARRGDGRVLCWGDTPGDGTDWAPSPVLVPLLGVNELRAGSEGFPCARAGTDWYCWRGSTRNLTGVGDDYVEVPTRLPLSAPADSVTREYSIGCALTNGAVACWGYDSPARSRYAEPVALPGRVLASAPQPVALPIAPTELECAYGTCCGSRGNDVACWGSVTSPLMFGYPNTQPTTPLGIVNPSSFASGYATSCAVDVSGLQCWGARPGFADGFERNLPAPLPLPNIVKVAIAEQRMCALDSSGAVFCWGSDYAGDAAKTYNSLVPRLVDASMMGAVVDIGVGNSSSCALDDEGAIWCWGDGYEGRCGNGTASCKTPVRVSETLVFTALSVDDGACGVTTDGNLYCWGSGSFGRLGDGDDEDRYQPVQVVGAGGVGVLDNVVAVSMASAFTCALRGDGHVWCFGLNSDHQLGNGLTTASSVPVEVHDLSDATALQCVYGCVARRAGGTWVGWGPNYQQALGITSTDPVPTPVPALWNTAFAQVWLFGGGGCASESGGNVQCWGVTQEVGGSPHNFRALPLLTTQTLP